MDINLLPQEAVDQLANCKNKEDVLSLAEQYDVPLDEDALNAIDAVEGEDYTALNGCGGEEKSTHSISVTIEPKHEKWRGEVKMLKVRNIKSIL